MRAQSPSPPPVAARSVRSPSPSAVSAITGRAATTQQQLQSTHSAPAPSPAMLRPVGSSVALPQRTQPLSIATNQVRATLAAQQQNKVQGQTQGAVSHSPPRSGRMGTKRLPPPPPGNVSNLASKHPSQRFTPEEMRLLWETLEGEESTHCHLAFKCGSAIGTETDTRARMHAHAQRTCFTTLARRILVRSRDD
jgi:hypothetical protein